MKKIIFFLLLVINLIFFNSNFVFSKVVEDKIILGATISLTGKYSSNGELLAYMDQNVAQKAAELGRQQNPDLIGDPDKILMSYE